MIDKNLKTILLVITKGDVGGAQVHCLDIIRRLGRKYHFVLVCGEDEFLAREVRKEGADVYILSSLVRSISPSLDIAACRSLKALIIELKPAIVHAHSSKAGVIARLAAHLAGTPSIFTAHGWAFTEGAPTSQRYIGLVCEWLLGRLAAATITVSKYDYALAKRYKVANVRRLHVVQNGVEGKNQKRHSTSMIPKLITVGRLTPVKNQKLLIDSLANIDSEYTAIIVGSGVNHVELQSQIKKLDLESKITLALNIDDVTDALAGSDIFVLSSLYEGLPLSILEAMSAQLPVVSTDVGGVAEAVIDGETGYLVGRNDVKAMTEKLSELLNNEELRVSMGRAGYLRYQQYFTASRMSEEVDNIYQQVLFNS